MRYGMTAELSPPSSGTRVLTITLAKQFRRRIPLLLLLSVLLFAVGSARAEEIHPEAFAGTVASRAGEDVGLRVQPGVEFGHEEKLWVYQKRDVIEIGGVIVKVNWARVGKIWISSFDGESAEAVVLEEYADSEIGVGDEVGKLPNTSPKIDSLVADSSQVRPGHEVSIYVMAHDDEGDSLHYLTEASGGTLLRLNDTSPVMQWVAPERPGTYNIGVYLSDGKGGNSSGELVIEVPAVSETDLYGLVSAVGGNNKAAWQFGEVTDIEIDERDNMWVLDAKVNLIRRISPAGVRLGAIDLTRGGSGVGVAPSKLRVRHEGFVHVLDISNKSLDRLDINGNLVDRIFEASNRKAFLLETPSGVELTRAGELLITDSTGGHVVAIDNGGRFMLLFAAQGTGQGQLSSPISITANESGDIYVLDSGKDEILEFDRTFRFRTSYPCPMQGEAGKILTDSRGGSVFVLDGDSASVRKLDDDGKLITHVSSIKGKDSGGPAATSMAVRPDGRILIGTANASIWEFDSGGALRGILGEENFGKVPSIAATDDGDLFVLDSSLAQVKRFDRHGWLRGRFGEKGKYGGQFQRPLRICVDGQGNCYVFDDAADSIQRFNATGAFDKLLTVGQDVAAHLKDAVDIDVRKDGAIYTLDAKRKAVFILSREGELQKIVPLTASGARSPKQIKRPAHLAVDGLGTIYISDPSQFAVHKFDAEGRQIRTLGEKGKEPGQFGRIGDLAADSRGFVYVLLTDSRSVAKFDRDGNFLMEIVLNADEDSPLRNPEVVTADSFGSLYVYDSYYSAVFKFMQ